MISRYKVIVKTTLLSNMAGKLITLITVMSLVGLSSGFTYSDLIAMNSTCEPKDTCRSDKRPRMGDPNNWKYRNCFCDNLCAEYGDCCLDAGAYNVEEQTTNADKYVCVNLKQFGDKYMRGSCMSGWEDQEIAALCTNNFSSDLYRDSNDPLTELPVTSHDSSVTYTNFYCAICNNDSTSLEVWKPYLECPTVLQYQAREKNLTKEYVAANLVFNEGRWGFYLDDQGIKVFHTCYVDPVLPETVSHKVRECKTMIMTCASDWNDTEVENLCHSYTAVTYLNEQAYRNRHCSRCNHVPDEYMQCSHEVFTRFRSFDKEFNPAAFSLLFDFVDHGGSNAVGSTSTCGNGEVFDPFFKKCRNVICGKINQEYRYGRCVDLEATDEMSSTSSSTTSTTTVSPASTTTTEAPFHVIDSSGEETTVEPVNSTLQPIIADTTSSIAVTLTVISTEASSDIIDSSSEQTQSLTCERFLLPDDEFKMGSNGTVVVEKYGRTYLPHEYERREGGILVCIIQPETDKFSRLMGWISLAGLGLSCVCILMHLIAFLLVPELRNLSGKNLASLCLVLLAAYITFILSVFGEPGKTECFILAAAMYYFFLSSFCWMNIMAFDIWRTLRLATSELRVSAGGQWRKFFTYSLYGWVFPGMALVVLVTLDLVRPDVMPSQFFPALGERWCWFGQRKALLVFFASPLITIMVVNIIFFIFSARIIAETTQSTAKMTSCSPHQNQFKLYMRLALLMGLTWISGIVAAYLQLEPIWYIFVLLSTLQGVFIFLAFTCTRKVWRVAGSGCWRRVVLATRVGAPWVVRSPSSSRQGLESRDSHDSQLSHASHSSVTRLTSNSRTSVDAF